uniref:Pentatricopeptide repeat-containing protein n=1 Tax=Kalanchoe fedtschenkoi TaxID=63787 RepID=A0A7N0TEL4_KALFE
MHPSFKLYRALRQLPAPGNSNSSPTLSARFTNVMLRPFCSRHSTLALGELAKTADSSLVPELPGWLKLSRKNFAFFNDPDGDFGIPEISEWAKNQMPSDCDGIGSASGFGMVDDVERDAEKISMVLKIVFDSPENVAKAITDCGGFRASEGLVMKLSVRFSNDWIPAFGVSESVYNMVVDVLGKSRKFELMRQVVEEMHQLGKGLVTTTTMHKIMRRLARASQWHDVVDVYKSISYFGIEKNVEMLNMLLDVLVKDGGIELVVQALQDFRHETPPNTITFNILIHGWCKARKIDQAHSFVEAYCRERNFSKVDELLIEMKERGCPPNTITYNVCIIAFGKARELRRALDIFERLKGDGHVPEAPLYCSLIYYLGKLGNQSDAEKLYENMLQHGVMPNLMTYSSMINMYCLQSREKEALKMLLEMEKSNKQMKVLAFLLHHMFKNDVSPEAGAYTLLVHELCKSRMLEHARLFFEEMVFKGFTPMPTTCDLLMKSFQEEGMTEYMDQIAKLISQTNGME